MIKKLKSIVLSLAAVSTMAAVPALAVAPAAFAQTNIVNSLCNGSQFQITDTATGNCPANTNTSQFNALLARVINIFSAIVGVIAVIMIIVGGLRYITSGGDSGKVSGAKTTIMYALIGLVVVALAQLVVHFVLNQAGSIATGA